MGTSVWGHGEGLHGNHGGISTGVGSGRFGGLLRLLGLSTHRAKAAAEADGRPEALYLSRNGWIPNNERLPVLLYRGALQPVSGRPMSKFEETFRKNWWLPQSRNSIYDFHHYHSTAHEVLGFARGHGRLMLGGENGQELAVEAGDVLVLPAGTGHCKIEATEDFLSIGGYPPATDWDICRKAPTVEMMARMRRLATPRYDPVTGLHGSLTQLWPEAEIAEAS